MRRIVLSFFIVLSSITLFAQNDSAARKPSVTLPRANDHFLMQLGYTTWQGKPDSIQTGGLPRTFNMYFLFDYPFKTNPHWSVAIGAGIATDNMFFDKTTVGIKDPTTRVIFADVSDTSNFKKYKLATAYLEAPVELRFALNPDNNARSFKFAIGAKVGTLLNAHTKGKTLRDKGGNTLISYTLKENSKRFFNQNRLSLTARVGVGHFSLFGSYAVTPLFKEGLGPVIRPMSVGLTLSGL